MNITELNGTEINGAGGVLVPNTLGFYGRTVRAATGAAVESAEVFVFDTAGNPVDVWSDGVNGAPEILDQPLLTDVTGAFRFYVPFGTYNLTVSFLGETVELNNQSVGPDRKYVDLKEPALPEGSTAYFVEGKAPRGWVDMTVPIDPATSPLLAELLGSAGPPDFLEAAKRPASLIASTVALGVTGFTPGTGYPRDPRFCKVGSTIYLAVTSADVTTDTIAMLLLEVDPEDDYRPTGVIREVPVSAFRNLDQIPDAPLQVGYGDVIIYPSTTTPFLAGLRINGDGTYTQLEFSAQDVIDGEFDNSERGMLQYASGGGLGVFYHGGNAGSFGNPPQPNSEYYVIDENTFTLTKVVGGFDNGDRDPALGRYVVAKDGSHALFFQPAGDPELYSAEFNATIETIYSSGEDPYDSAPRDISPDLNWLAGVTYSNDGDAFLSVGNTLPWFVAFENEGAANVGGRINNNDYAIQYKSVPIRLAGATADALIDLRFTPDSKYIMVHANFALSAERIAVYRAEDLKWMGDVPLDYYKPNGQRRALSEANASGQTKVAAIEVTCDQTDGAVYARIEAGDLLDAGLVQLPSPPAIRGESTTLKPYTKAPEE